LHEALDDRTPLLERVGFLAIFTSNLDEFFQKRVGGLKRQIAAGIVTRTPDGRSPQQQLSAIRQDVVELIRIQAECYQRTIQPQLAEVGIHLLNWEQLSDEERQRATRYFHENLFPVLTPLSVDPGHPFPFISNLSSSLGVMLRYPTGHAGANGLDAGELQFARVKVPAMLPGWIRVDDPARRIEEPRQVRMISLEQVIRHNLQDLFEGMTIESIMPFRVTRNADVERDEEDAEDLLELIEQELRDRRFARVIRLEVPTHLDPKILQFLTEALELDEQDVYELPGEMDYTDLLTVQELNWPELKYRPWTPVMPPRLADNEADMFSIIRQGDVLVHHPYESFSASVERFIRTAAADPKVVAIKQTLYRTSMDSPFIPALIRAAESGKQVVCLVELKARFDEERNIGVAQSLEKAGVHVVYGIIGLKTHTKTAIVVRHESEGMRVYCHIGTGNYNSKTAQLYTDLGLFTCRSDITGDLVHLFHYLTGRSVKHDFPHLLIAPINMERRFLEMIDREIAHCATWRSRGGHPQDPQRPRIIAKMNSLEDVNICERLYEASRAGVRIDLIVRGFCCLRPGVEGLSDNVSVISVIGRFLEHSRIFYFQNGGRPEYFIGSADWMYRNLRNRVECVTPIVEPALQQRLGQILEILLHDQRQVWQMQADGSYVQRRPAADEPRTGTHETLMELSRREASVWT
jgi:polyphosphate kinase